MDSRCLLYTAVCLISVTTAAPGILDSDSLKHIANASYAMDAQGSGDIMAAVYSPRMDFEQWKPLTGRGDPLRNDPTYDYEPPVLERVHYWADEPRPDKKSEVLMLGITSRKPSVTPRQPPRRPHRPTPPKYEDYTYKLSEHYPMTILVPPPPPPPGHQPLLFTLSDKNQKTQNTHQVRSTERPTLITNDPSPDTSHLNSLYALQEANLIYQSSTTSQNWHLGNSTKQLASSTISSDYVGWGPTTPLDDDNSTNDTNNFIFNDNFELSKHPYSFYRPMLSEAPPPPEPTPHPLFLPTFVPTALPAVVTTLPAMVTTQPTTRTTERETDTVPIETTTKSADTEFQEETTTKRQTTFQTTSIPFLTSNEESYPFGMMGSMLTMPLVNGPERPEDNLYAHASENIHVYKEQQEDMIHLESMQTMQPPPPKPIRTTESTTLLHKRPFHAGPNMFGNSYKKSVMSTLDPYIHMRFTTSAPTVASMVESYENTISTTESPVIPTYLIIQGHSKVKTYSSKAKNPLEKEFKFNEIPKPNETNEVKHLHPIKDKNTKKVDKTEKTRLNSARNLKSLLDEGIGSIEIQEADVGIKYDVSDGSDVPVEIYRKGIVQSDENDYSSRKKRPKRQLDLEDLLPFDQDQIEEFVLNFLNKTGITGMIAPEVTSDAADAVDEDEDYGDR